MSTPFSSAMTLQALVAVMFIYLSVAATEKALADVSANRIGAFRTALAGILARLYCPSEAGPDLCGSGTAWPPTPQKRLLPHKFAVLLASQGN